MQVPKPTEEDRVAFTALVPDDPRVEVKPMFRQPRRLRQRQHVPGSVRFAGRRQGAGGGGATGAGGRWGAVRAGGPADGRLRRAARRVAGPCGDRAGVGHRRAGARRGAAAQGGEEDGADDGDQGPGPRAEDQIGSPAHGAVSLRRCPRAGNRAGPGRGHLPRRCPRPAPDRKPLAGVRASSAGGRVSMRIPGYARMNEGWPSGCPVPRGRRETIQPWTRVRCVSGDPPGGVASRLGAGPGRRPAGRSHPAARVGRGAAPVGARGAVGAWAGDVRGAGAARAAGCVAAAQRGALPGVRGCGGGALTVGSASRPVSPPGRRPVRSARRPSRIVRSGPRRLRTGSAPWHAGYPRRMAGLSGAFWALLGLRQCACCGRVVPRRTAGRSQAMPGQFLCRRCREDEEAGARLRDL